MKFYRARQQIEAITFDLDDTLYDNGPVIRRTEAETMAFLRQYHPAMADIDAQEWRDVRAELLARDTEICHDVTAWRHQALYCAMLRRGLHEEQARVGAEATMQHFAHWRSQIDVPQETHDTLTLLATRWPLVAITNGNANPDLIGLSDYFQFTLVAGRDGRSKPWDDMYQLAAERLQLPLAHILHVGDDLTTDVAGSVRCGMQSCWINLRAGNLMQIDDSRLLPHMEISQLASLTLLR
ncbi:MAG: 5-amino-6-(5-phospho-D-ribitylamino)uracil phosphatase YigB [Rouxiella aceris]|uniref:5-amino-6-(5-phospho-D-ribitylamino)uracil phosphatase YigB n=1 Tax=Rouxiella aceris TaxID=2703884 RepID=UPI002845009A|nr:5-amino-6-(5-phospho-D-ribitylamino)uracil phosphatase YigB [Rouxiella aceris]MDR3433430.1 5-amino-6-(5-phospho-D-ribitylamino)uracil phosphatase YigB [Rouxiella aceris]